MNYTLEKTKKELYELLDKNPELVEYQNKISKAMDSTKNENRLKVLGFFLQHNLSDLLFELMELKKILNERYY
jgi:hypothetical protein